MLQDEQVFNVARPEDLMDQPLFTQKQGPSRVAALPLPLSKGDQAANTFTYSQKKKLKTKEKVLPEGVNLKSEVLDPAYADKLRTGRAEFGISAKRRKVAEDAWMRKLTEGDYSGPTLDRSRYLVMRNATIEGNPR